jgi:hypothetical protein
VKFEAAPIVAVSRIVFSIGRPTCRVECQIGLGTFESTFYQHSRSPDLDMFRVSTGGQG